MAKEDKAPESPLSDDQPQGQAGGSQVRIRVDERNMTTGYANGFRTNGTAEEVMIDFGLNMTQPHADPKAPAEVTFSVNDRVILNYHSAKRLAITLSQLIRRHEEQFGELELDVNKRRKADS